MKGRIGKLLSIKPIITILSVSGYTREDEE